jgi:hypothetical protein
MKTTLWTNCSFRGKLSKITTWNYAWLLDVNCELWHSNYIKIPNEKHIHANEAEDYLAVSCTKNVFRIFLQKKKRAVFL